MNVSPRLVELLERAGIDAAHWSDLGEPSDLDQAISDVAAELDAAIVTHDLDFGALLARSGKARPSVIQIRADDLTVERLAERIIYVCAELRAEIEAEALVSLDVESARLRVLPIHRQ